MTIKEILKHIEKTNELKKVLELRPVSIELSINEHDYEEIKNVFEIVGKINNYLRCDTNEEFFDIYNVVTTLDFTKTYGNTLSAEFYMNRKVKLDLFIDFSD